MTNQTRDVFILAAFVAGYGALLWLAEHLVGDAIMADWSETFKRTPQTIFAREHLRDTLMAQEFGEISEAPDATD